MLACCCLLAEKEIKNQTHGKLGIQRGEMKPLRGVAEAFYSRM